MATKTINLIGAEFAVTGLDGAHAHIRNDSTDTIYAAKMPGITAGADGVASIPAGQADTLRGISGAVYLLGTGSALIQSDDYVESPFKASTASGGSAVDDVARAAVSTHAGNADIHVTFEDKRKWNMGVGFVTFNGHVSDSTAHTTAEEKAAWNGKAELSDIPKTLPANGGSADSATYQRQAYLGSGIDILDYVINNVPDMSTYLCGVTNCPTCPTNYGYDADSNDFYYRISRYTSTYAVIKAYDIGSNNEFMNTLSNGVWTGWNKCSDNGNAATANTAGTLSATPSNICLRNISAGTADLSAGVSELETGAIYIVYE